MKSIRLTKDIRRSILDNVMKVWEADNPVPAAVSDAARKLAHRSFLESHGERYEIAYNVMTDDILSGRDTFINTTCGGRFIVKETNTVISFCWTGSEHLPGINDMRLCGMIEPTSVSNEWLEYIDYKSAVNDEESWRIERDVVCRQVKTLLESSSTSSRLIEQWPEIKPYVEPFMRSGKTTLPAIPVERINKILGWE